MKSEPEDWTRTERENGAIMAENAKMVIMKLEDVKGQVFKRNGIHRSIGPGGRNGHERMLVVDVDGVRVYAQTGEDGRVQVVVTKQDIYL